MQPSAAYGDRKCSEYHQQILYIDLEADLKEKELH